MDYTIGTSQTSVAISRTGAGTVIGYYSKFISQPLDQTSISAQTWTYAFSAAETSTSNNFPGTGGGSNKPVLVNCYVWRPSDGSLVGTILDGNTASTVDEAGANVQRWHIVSFTGSAVNNVQKGDVLVFEVWFQSVSIASSTTTTFYFDGTTDTYIENATSTSAASYIETPEDLAFVGWRRITTEVVAMGESAAVMKTPGVSMLNVSAKKGTITLDATSGVHDQAFTAVGFQPKGLLFWGVLTSADNTYAEGYSTFYGFSDGTNDASVAAATVDNVTTYDCANIVRNDACITLLSTAAGNAEIIRGTVKSLDTDGFTITWNVKSNTTQYILHYLAIGGSDITNVFVKQETAGRTTIGNQAYTGVGFKPDVELFGAGGYVTVNTLSAGAMFSVGSAVTPAKQFANLIKVVDISNVVDAQNAGVYVASQQCLAAAKHAQGFSTFDLRASLVSHDDDGFTLSHNTAPVASAFPFIYMAIKGGFWDCGVINQKSGVGTQIIQQNIYTDPEALLLAISDDTAINQTSITNTSSVNVSMGIGACDTNAAEGYAFFGDLYQTSPNRPVMISSTSKLIRNAVPAATATSSTTDCESDISEMDIPSQCTLDWTTADATLRKIGFLMLSKSVQTGGGEPTQTRTISESTVDVSTPTPPERLTAKLRPHTIESMSASATFIDRTSYKGRALTTQIVTAPTEDPPLRAIGRTKLLSTETITVQTGTLARLAAKIRGLTLQSVTTLPAESLVRLGEKIRALTTETITAVEPSIPDWIKKVNIVKALSTESVTISSSLDRLGTKLRALSSGMAGAIAISGTVAQLKTTGIHAVERTLSAAEAGIVSITTPEGLTRLTATILALTTETVTISAETLARAQNKFRQITNESVSLAGNVVRIKARFKVLATQTVSIPSESILRVINKLRSPSTGAEDVAVSTSAFSRLVAKWRQAPTETVVIPATAVNRLSVMSKSLATQSVSIAAGTLVKISGKVRTLPFAAEAVGLSEVKVRLADKVRLLPDETVNIFANLVNSVNEIAEESVAISDEVTRTVRHVLEISRQMALQQVTVSAGIASRAKGTYRRMDLAAVSVSGIPDRLATKFRSIVIESVTLSGLGARIKTHMGIPATGNEIVAIPIESIVRVSGKIRVLVTQVLNVSDSKARLTAKARAITSETTVTVQDTVDSLTKNLKYITRTLTENVAVSSSLARLVQKLRIITTETVITSDSLSRRKTSLRIIATQIVTSSETVIQRLVKVRALSTQTVTVSEQSLTRLLNKMRIVSTQIVTVYESAIRIKNKVKPLSTESVTIPAGTLARLITKIRIVTAVAETVTISEQSLARLTNKLRVLATQVVTVSAAAPQQIKNLSVNNVVKTLPTEIASISDSIIRRLAKVRVLSSEILSISTTLARLTSKRRSQVIQQVTIFETLAKLKTHIINEVVRSLPTESLTIALESLTRGIKKHRTIRQGLSIAELLRVFKNGIELLEVARPGFGGQTTPYRKVSPRLPKLKQILYPVYSPSAMQRIERRRKLRAYGPLTIIPAFKYNINETVAPFIITNRVNNRITVRFALSQPKQLDQPKLVFNTGKSLPIIISARQQKQKLNKAKAKFIMNQAGVERVQSQRDKLTRLFKLMKVWRIAQTLSSL